MCYFLYSTVNSEINYEKAVEISKKYNYQLNIGSANDLIEKIERNDDKYRLTNKICDCDSTIGKHNSDSKEINLFSQYVEEIRNVKGAKNICLMKKWTDEKIKGKEEVHIDDIDIKEYLANLKEDTVYKMSLYKKYYTNTEQEIINDK